MERDVGLVISFKISKKLLDVDEQSCRENYLNTEKALNQDIGEGEKRQLK